MVAAKTAHRTNPTINGWNDCWTILIKTCSGSGRYPLKKATPTAPTSVAAERERTIHVIPIHFDLEISETFRIPMNLVTIWGCPKYPSPHPRAMEIIDTNVLL